MNNNKIKRIAKKRKLPQQHKTTTKTTTTHTNTHPHKNKEYD